MKKDIDIFLVKRNNLDKKKYKVIHPFDGRIIPLEPITLKKYSILLSKKICFKNANYIVGFAEGGILSAYGLSEVTGIPMVGSYRVRLKVKNEITFEEPHSMRSQHFIYNLKAGDKIIIIEDEITTGSTLLNAVKTFKDSGIEVLDVGTFVLMNSKRNEKNVREAEKILNIKIKYLFNENQISKKTNK